MKPPPFAYCRPHSLDEALEFLAEHGDEARPLAGGQSLVPMLNHRLARPAVLVDIGAIGDLQRMDRNESGWVIGATVTQRRVERDGTEGCDLLRLAMPFIGHRQIRARGTVGGSIAHADPAAELPAVALTLGATMVAASPDGEREIPAAAFFAGPYMNSLEDGEVLSHVIFPTVPPTTRCSFREFARRKGDFAVAGVAAAVDFEDGSVTAASLTAFAVGANPVRLTSAEAAVAGRHLDEAALTDSAEAAAAEIEPWDDIHGSSQYRRQLVAALLRRALQEVAP
ncbi:MAG: xanthine dehydrogenase family protein subunit M [Acidimicrobiaceae bacterium]|nr:xanthine dehydrogenase family protein subunit M [Acidimicrobiaceae bacterium]MCY3645056.1 xanthine dehydrogenase family protein subunit M [Acidimicrobiaceae bacterium]MDE0492314.1 xanthine dehydrogenase family protein subunit M [Acidimicrobiaceae bacterium]MDE0665586.1 xanthine dehydrogenase family protein subunit M [Acidimicrobiaceae bacterium]MXY11967.1 xanthine dehydrogenase family protein subunit M [Acidimicrobiaceae bacterium]